MNKEIRKIIILLIILAMFFGIYKGFNIENKILIHFYPKKYEEYVYKYSKELNIDPMLTFAIIKTESNFKENIVSRSGAIGLMQLMEETAKEQAAKIGMNYNSETLYNPEDNIKLGLYYFDTLFNYFNENYILAFVAYNAGLGNTKKWINEGILKENGEGAENIPFTETNMYVRKIVRNYKIYSELYKERPSL